MRIGITGDTHVNNNVYGIRDPETGLMIKTADAFKALGFFVDESIDRKLDRVVIVGDVFHNHFPSNMIRRMFDAQMQKLVEAGIQVVLMVGNHDACRDHHALMPLKGWNRLLKVVDTELVETAKDFTAVYVPHTNDVERKVQRFPELIRKIEMPEVPVKPVIFFGHFSVTGAMKNDVNKNTSRSDSSAADIMSTGADIAFLGHYHKHQPIKADIPIHYVGSLERHRMDELNGKRGFYIYDTETQESEWVDWDGARPMKRLVATSFEEAMQDIREDDWEGHIVSIEFEGDEREYAEARARLPDIEKVFAELGGVHITITNKTRCAERDEDGVEIMTADEVDLLKILRRHIDEDFENRPEELEKHHALLDDIYKRATARP